GVTEIPAVLRPELVDEDVERRAVVKLETANLERHPWDIRKLRRPAPPVDAFATAVEGRQHAADPLDLPDPIELAHPGLGFHRMPGPNVLFAPMEAELVKELPAGDGWQFELKCDGVRRVLADAGGEGAFRPATER